MGPRVKRSSPSAGRQSVLSLATVEEIEAGPTSNHNVSDIVTLPGRPISRIQSAPVLTSHEILAGYETVIRNKSLELCPPDRPPPPAPRWANRAPRPMPPPKPVALRSNSTPILPPSASPPEESREIASQIPCPSEYVRSVIPVFPKEKIDVIEPVAAVPLRSSTPENLPILERPRKRKSYRHSLTIRFRRLMPEYRSKKRLTKVSTSIATATAIQPDLNSFFTPPSNPHHEEKVMLKSDYTSRL